MMILTDLKIPNPRIITLAKNFLMLPVEVVPPKKLNQRKDVGYEYFLSNSYIL